MTACVEPIDEKINEESIWNGSPKTDTWGDPHRKLWTA